MQRLAFAVILALAAASSDGGAQPASAPPAPLLVVGLDGFSPAYLDTADVPVLRGLAARGVRADGLVPPFPTKTFPSFTTIATGLWPARHGIVANTMDDPAIPGRFTLADHATRSDPRWWLGEPIWNAAERQGRRTASLFWPGDDVAIGGRRPSTWRRYDDDYPNPARVAEVVEWLARPPAERPALAMVYFSLVDTAAHEHGPVSAPALAAAAAADRLVGDLVAGLARRGLDDAVNMVVVSDHGLAETRLDRIIVLDDLVDMTTVDVLETGPMLRLAPADASGVAADQEVERLLARLRDAHPRLAVYRGRELPARYHAQSVRTPPIVAVADEGWLILTRAQRDRWSARGGGPHGDHGFAPEAPSMHGLLIASGPAFRAGLRVPPIGSVHLYELFCRLLGIAPAPNDGDPAVTAALIVR
jgi:predicted AlkP superfamily pyrophosphatase or phosphodiesterase